MAKVKLGDRVNVKLDGSKVVSPYSDYTDIRTFDVVGIDEDDCFLYIPSYIIVSGTFKVDKYNYKTLDISPKFVGEEVIRISENKIDKIINSVDGMFCDTCKEFYDYAEPNSGNLLICWSCRQRSY